MQLCVIDKNGNEFKCNEIDTQCIIRSPTDWHIDFEYDWLKDYILSFKWLKSAWNEYFEWSNGSCVDNDDTKKIILLCGWNNCFDQHSAKFSKHRKAIFQ